VVPPSQFGVGTPEPVRGFIDALDASTGGRDNVVFVNNGFKGGDIEGLIDYLSVSVRTAGKTATVLDSEDGLLTTCRSSLRGVSSCYGAASFYSSPTEGPGGIWNYTLRADGSLDGKIYVNKHNNDAEIYILPFQHAVDMAIANQFSNSTGQTFPTTVNEYPFTSKNQQQRADDIRTTYMNAVIHVLGVTFFIGMVCLRLILFSQ
jgi:ATP-binding cassette subfamily A (ABC1) protein 3